MSHSSYALLSNAEERPAAPLSTQASEIVPSSAATNNANKEALAKRYAQIATAVGLYW